MAHVEGSTIPSIAPLHWSRGADCELFHAIAELSGRFSNKMDEGDFFELKAIFRREFDESPKDSI